MSNSTEIQVSSQPTFNFGDHPVRVVVRGSEPWFVAADVCGALDYKNTSKAIADHLDADERYNQSLERGGSQVLINESGLYALVLRSRKPEARKFAKWVTSEVLPSIRKTGKFEAKASAGPLTIEMREKLKTMLVQKLDAQQYTAAIGLLAKMQVNWELVDDDAPVPAKPSYHFPLELADPHDRKFGNAWMTPRVLLDPKNRPLELELIEQLEKDGHDVTGVKMRILGMREAMGQVEEIQKLLAKVKERLGPLMEICTVGTMQRGKNVMFVGKPNPNSVIDQMCFGDQMGAKPQGV